MTEFGARSTCPPDCDLSKSRVAEIIGAADAFLHISDMRRVAAQEQQQRNECRVGRPPGKREHHECGTIAISQETLTGRSCRKNGPIGCRNAFAIGYRAGSSCRMAATASSAKTAA